MADQIDATERACRVIDGAMALASWAAAATDAELLPARLTAYERGCSLASDCLQAALQLAGAAPSTQAAAVSELAAVASLLADRVLAPEASPSAEAA